MNRLLAFDGNYQAKYIKDLCERYVDIQYEDHAVTLWNHITNELYRLKFVDSPMPLIDLRSQLEKERCENNINRMTEEAYAAITN